MAPSEGIEPPAEEPESSVLSITPRGLDVVLGQYVKRMIHPILTYKVRLKWRLSYYTKVVRTFQL